MNDPWSTVPLPIGQTLAWTFGPLTIYLQRTAYECLIACDRADEESDDLRVAVEQEKPETLEWERFAIGEGYDRLTLRPMLSDRPLVVRPASSLVVPPDTDSTFYARVPLWLRIDLVHDGAQLPLTLSELPVVILSNTWFGENTMSGRLCYGMRTVAHRDLGHLPPRYHRAVCPFRIHNTSDEPLNCERFCLEIPHLALHRRNDVFWTPTVLITHRGAEAGQSIEFSDKAPDGTPLGQAVVPPREPIRGGLLRRNISTFSLTKLFR